MTSDKEPARNKTSHYANQLPQSLSDSSIVKLSLPSEYELPSQAQSIPAIYNGTLVVPRTPSAATTPNQRALRSSSSSSKQDPGAKASKVGENGKDEILTETAKGIEETMGEGMKSKPATNRRQQPEHQHDDSTTRGGELSASTPDPSGPKAPVAKRLASSHRSSGSKQFLNSASTPTAWPSSAPLVTLESPLPKIRLHHSGADKDWNDGLDHATSMGLNTPLRNSGVSTPSGKGDESFFGSSLLLEGGFDSDPDSRDGFDSDPDSQDGFDSDPDSQDDSRALVLMSPSPTPHRRSVSSDLICPTPLGGVNVIWNWVTTKRRDKNIQPFFWIALLLCRTLAERDISRGYVYAFKVVDPQGRDYVKIGFTKGLVSRMKAHSVCYGDCEQIYPLTDERPALVNHARRVEQLVHAELVGQSMSLEKCPRARQKHNCHGEWFDVNPQHAVNVIRKWSECMNSNPYEKRSIPVAKTKKRNSAGGPMKTAWQLGVLQQDVITRICWPTAMTVDDGETSELGKGIRLLTFG